MHLIFVAIVLPPLFMLTVWGIVIAARVLVLSMPSAEKSNPAWESHGEMVFEDAGGPVCARDIRERRRRYLFAAGTVAYSFSGTPQGSTGFPDVWQDDLWERRN